MASVRTFTPTKSFGSNTYLVESGGEFALIDPSVPPSEILRSCPEVGYGLKYIILTHCHFDHILELDSWREATGATVIASEIDGRGLSDSYRNAYSLFFGVDKGYYGPYTAVTDGDRLPLGDEVMRIMHTPGHTGGGITVILDGHVFVGDTVFADGGYGRCDLPGGDFSTLMASIREISRLDKSATVYPGHGRPTDISEIRCYFSNIN